MLLLNAQAGAVFGKEFIDFGHNGSKMQADTPGT